MIPSAVKLAIFVAVVTCSRAMDGKAMLLPEQSRNETTCPPWYTPDPADDECSFVHQLPQIVRQYGNSSELEMGFCMTVTNASIVVAQCPYIPVSNNIRHLYHNIYRVLPTDLDEVNSSLCALYNRRGYLCSECKEGHGLAAYRYYGLMCVKCSHPALMVTAYIILLFVPPTFSFFLFFLFKTNIHSGYLTSFIFFSHTIVTTMFFFPHLLILPQSLFGYWPLQVIMSFYAVWSLDFVQFLIPPFCVSPHLTTLQLISLGYVPSIYPLILCVVTFYLIQLHAKGNKCIVALWKPFKKLLKLKVKDLSSIIYTFGSFILLSYGKNLFVSFSLFQQYFLVALDRNSDRLRTLQPLSTDLKTPFFSPSHAPYFVLGIVGGVVTVVLPLVLVLIFPTRIFPKLIPCCGLRRWHAMRTFMELFTGSYKDGTESGQRDYRFFAGLYLIGRIAVALSWANHAGPNTSLVQSYAWLVTAMPFILVAVMFAFFKPHRRLCDNAIDVLLFLLLAKFCLLFHFIYDVTVSEATLKVLGLIVLIDLAIPQAVYIAFITFRLVRWIYCARFIKNCCNGQESYPLIPKL
jgi:hypothetical protein